MEREEAIEIVRKNYPHVGFSGSEFETALRELIPELAESEDERIRKFLLGIVDNLEPKDFVGVKKMNVISWLENQKEATNFGELMNKLTAKEQEVMFNAWPKEEKQKEPHYTKRNALFDKCVENCDPEVMKEVSDKVDEMLVKEQQPAEWSEEDEKIWKDIFELCNRFGYDDACKLLKSRLSQSYWKPSEEQMDSFRDTIIQTKGYSYSRYLPELYEQLKKLM